MKNNRLTNTELLTLQKCAREIRRLVSMEGCAFEKQETVSMHDLKLWLQWFEVEAYEIDKITHPSIL